MECTCPQCGEALETAPGYEGARVECPLCGAMFSPDLMRTDDAVIDVHAEPAHETTRDSSTSGPDPSTERPVNAAAVRRFRHDHGAPQPQKVYIERRVMAGDSGCGCNGCGCLLLILVLMFLLLGCQVVMG